MSQDKPCRVAPDGKISLIDFAGKTFPFLTPSRCAERIRRHVRLHPYRLTNGQISKYAFHGRGQRAGTWVCTPEVASEVVKHFATDWNVRRSRAHQCVSDQTTSTVAAAGHLESVRDGLAVLGEIAPDTTSALEPALDQAVTTVCAEEQTVPPPFELLTPILTYEQDGEEEYDFDNFPDHY